MICKDILEAVGNTPLVRLNRMPEEDSAEILVKVESLNVGGSIKTRTALNMLLQAEKEGLIDRDSIIVEPTSGNQGIGLALWDSIASCVITGSSDASIREVRPNDLRIILDNAPIERIYCNGRKSHEMYEKTILPSLGREAACLPSTSPANAAWSLEKLIAAWSVILSDQK